MKKDLVTSNIDRQNVLNNRLAIENIQNQLDFPGMFFENEYRYTKKMVADFYQVDERTIERYIEQYSVELSGNGYILSKGKQLKDFKLQFGHVINVGSKTTQLGLFNFRAFLNIGIIDFDKILEETRRYYLRHSNSATVSRILQVLQQKLKEWVDEFNDEK